MILEEIKSLQNTPENCKKLFKFLEESRKMNNLLDSFKKQMTKGKYKKPLTDKQFEILKDYAI